MKKWIALFTCAAFTLSSLRADDFPPTPPSLPAPPAADMMETPVQEPQETPSEISDDVPEAMPDDGKKQVGQAANDGSQTGNGAGKYVLAGAAIAIGIAALILVSKNHGKKK